MRTLVTGGSGFLGRRLIPALMREGHEVIALSRSPSSDFVVAGFGATPWRGDLTLEDLALPNIEAVVNAAAHFRLAGPRAPYFAANVAGVQRLLSAARAAGARRFVQISAAAVAMDDRGSPLAAVDESAPVFPASFSAYIASKAQGEAAVLAAAAPNFQTLALRPPGIWGKGDAFSKALPGLLRGRRFGFIDNGAFPYVTCHVDNVVEGVLCALRAGVTGRAYFLNDAEATTFRAFVVDIARALGLDAARAPSMAYPFAWAAGGALEAIWRLAGASGDPPISRTMVRLIGRPFTTSDAAARRDLGYSGRMRRAEGLANYV